MSELRHRSEAGNSLWRHNPVLVQLFGLSPVLAVSTTLSNGAGLGIVTFVVLIFSALTATLLSNLINHTWRYMWFLCILAAYTSLLDGLIQWLYYPLYRELGIYIPLICCNFAILVRMELYSKNENRIAVLEDSVQTGLGFLFAICLLAALRELLTTGTVGSQLHLLMPGSAGIENGLGLTTENQLPSSELLEFASLAPAAFFILALIIAMKNLMDKHSSKLNQAPEQTIEPAIRARVTGRLKKTNE